MTLFTCAACGSNVQVPPGLEGSGWICRNCDANPTVLLESMEPEPSVDTPVEATVMDSKRPSAAPSRERSAAARQRRRNAGGKIAVGIVLLVMGLTGLYGGSILTGDANAIDMAFDLLGIGMILYGSVQVATDTE